MTSNSRLAAAAFAPASVANLGVGFDILGLALLEPGDTVRVEPREEPGAVIAAIHNDGGLLPRDPEKNTATVAANHVLKALNAPHGVALTIEKNLPAASGLGSSAASAVAAAVAVNALFGSPLSRADLLPCALEGEAVVSGYHADNIAPSLFGGILLIAGTEYAEMRSLPTPANLHLALVTPDVPVPTALARACLPTQIPLRLLVAQTGAVARLVDALYRGDIGDIGAVMERDSVIEPARAHLMPLLSEQRAAAKRAGACGLVISGAGPTLCAVCDSADSAARVARLMHAVYTEAHIGSTARATQVNAEGAKVILED